MLALKKIVSGFLFKYIQEFLKNIKYMYDHKMQCALCKFYMAALLFLSLDMRIFDKFGV